MIFLGVFYFFAIDVSWASRTCGLVPTSIWGNSKSLFLQTLLSLLSFWYFYYACYIFWSFPQLLDILFLISVFFLFAFQLWNFCHHILYLRDSFLIHIQFTDEPIRDILHLSYSIFDLQHFFLVLRISVFPLLLYISSCMSSTFSIKDLSIGIIVFKKIFLAW